MDDHRNHLRQKTPEAYQRYETGPGLQARVDWGECSEPIIHFGVKRKVYVFSMTLGYSRTQYIDFALDMTASTLMRCHLNAFRYFGGVPFTIIYDNMKTVVIEHIEDKVRFNERFLDFAHHYSFEPQAVPVCYPEGKGKVERSIGYIWSSFYTGRSFEGLVDLNNQGRRWLNEVCNIRIHGTTGERPIDRLRRNESIYNLFGGRSMTSARWYSAKFTRIAISSICRITTVFPTLMWARRWR